MNDNKEIVVKFNVEAVVLHIIPALLRKHDDVSHNLAEAFSEAVLKNYKELANESDK